MFNHFLMLVDRLTAWAKRERFQVLPGMDEGVPMDEVERLQNSGTTLPVMIEFARRGW